MKSDIREYLGKELLFYDGGTGTYLQSHGLKPGELPEAWNLTHRETMVQMHKGFLEAGSDILLTNTFGANAGKLEGTEYVFGGVGDGGHRECQRGCQTVSGGV